MGEREEELESRRMCLFISRQLEDPARATDAAKLPPVDPMHVSLWPSLMYGPTGDIEFQLIKMDSYKTTADIYSIHLGNLLNVDSNLVTLGGGLGLCISNTL